MSTVEREVNALEPDNCRGLACSLLIDNFTGRWGRKYCLNRVTDSLNIQPAVWLHCQEAGDVRNE